MIGVTLSAVRGHDTNSMTAEAALRMHGAVLLMAERQTCDPITPAADWLVHSVGSSPVYTVIPLSAYESESSDGTLTIAPC